MIRRLVAVTLAVACLSTSNPAFAGSAPDQTAERTASLKQQVIGIQAGTVIEVKLRQKGSKRITGRLGPVTDEGFEVQPVNSGKVSPVNSGKVSSEKVAFADVKSVKEKHGMSLVTKTLIVTGIVVAVLGVLAISIGRE